MDDQWDFSYQKIDSRLNLIKSNQFCKKQNLDQNR